MVERSVGASSVFTDEMVSIREIAVVLITVEGGSTAMVAIGNRPGDMVTMENGSVGVVAFENGSNDTVEDGLNNIVAMEDGLNNIVAMEDGSNNIIATEDGLNNIVAMEDGSNDIVAVEDGSNNIVAMEDQSNDIVTMEDRSVGMVTVKNESVVIVTKDNGSEHRSAQNFATEQKLDEMVVTDSTEAQVTDSSGQNDNHPDTMANASTTATESTDMDKASLLCKLCLKIFDGMSDLKHHREEKHDSSVIMDTCYSVISMVDTKYQCTECSKMFSRKYNLERHLSYKNVHKVEARSSRKPVPKLCDKCGKVFHSISAMCSHRKIHDKNKTNWFSCEYCQKQFAQRTNMMKHIDLKHKENKQLEICHLCGRSFTHCSGLKYHHQRKHLREAMIGRYKQLHLVSEVGVEPAKDELNIRKEGEMMFVCPVCPSSFPKVYNWYTHLAAHSEDSGLNAELRQKVLSVVDHIHGKDDMFKDLTLYPCGSCSYIGFIPTEIQTHMYRHSNVRPNKCSHCPKTFAKRTECLSHELTHTSVNRYKCTECDCGFSVLHNLHLHMASSHGGMSGGDGSHKVLTRCHTCHLCSKTFPYKAMVKKHLQAYHHLKEFTCNVCQKAFKTKYAAELHLRSHTQERPYVCSVCSKTFSDPSNLIHHGKRMHSDVPQDVFRMKKNVTDTSG